jgi:hypothetical protein
MLKQQVITAMEHAERSSIFSSNVLSLEGQLDALKSKISRLEDGSIYMTEILEGANEQLNCKLSGAPEYFQRYACWLSDYL